MRRGDALNDAKLREIIFSRQKSNFSCFNSNILIEKGVS